ncbi:pK196R [African swine fever virus]|uniref:Thymidine kinase n=1 Tax=African swine fever virus TaxID=10497 RepID=A0A6G6AHN1_ASF|nr:pK196R [African swine fever virus]
MNIIRKLKPGTISLVLGPMFAGKTTFLIHCIYMLERLEKKVVFIKSTKNTRDKTIKTHSGIQLRPKQCKIIESTQLSDVGSLTDIHAVVVDEAHFFDDLIKCRTWAEEEKIIILAGLNASFEQKMFPPIVRIFPYCSWVKYIGRTCMTCNQHNACFNVRKNADKTLILAGGSELYVTCCNNCLKNTFIKQLQPIKY